jgi:hypothetical protein
MPGRDAYLDGLLESRTLPTMHLRVFPLTGGWSYRFEAVHESGGEIVRQVVPEPAKSVAAFGLAHREGPLGQHAVLIPDLLRPNSRHDLPSIVEAIAEQAKRPDLQVGKGYVGGMHRSAGIRIADSLPGKLEHHVQCHGVPNGIALKAKLDAELGADLAGNFRRFRDEMPIGCGTDCAGRRQLAGAARRAHRLSLVGASVDDSNAGNGSLRRDHRRRLHRSCAWHGSKQRYDESRHPHETSALGKP